jgi:hypothetical protein
MIPGILVLALVGLLVALPASAAPSGAVDGTVVLGNGTNSIGTANTGEFFSDRTLCGDGTSTCNIAKVTITDADLSLTRTGKARIVTTASTGGTTAAPFLLTGAAGASHGAAVLGGETSLTMTSSTTGGSVAIVITLTDQKGTTATADDVTVFGRDADDDGDVDASDVTLRIGGVLKTPLVTVASGRITTVTVQAADNTAIGTNNITIAFETSDYDQATPANTPIASASVEFGADFLAASTRSVQTIDVIGNTAGSIKTTNDITFAAATDSILVTFNYNVLETKASLVTYSSPSLTARGLTRVISGVETTSSSAAFTSNLGLFSGVDFDKIVVAAGLTAVTTFDLLQADAVIAADAELTLRLTAIAPLLGIATTATTGTDQDEAGSDTNFVAAIMPIADGEILTVSYSDVGATATVSRSDTANIDLKAPAVSVVSPANGSYTNTLAQTLSVEVTDELSPGGQASGITVGNADTLMVNRVTNATDTATTLVQLLIASNSFRVSRSMTLVAGDEGKVRWWVPATDNAGNITKFADSRTKAQVAQAVTNPSILGVGDPANLSVVPGNPAAFWLDLNAPTIATTAVKTGGKIDTRLTVIPAGSHTPVATSTTILTDTQANFLATGDSLVKIGDTVTNLTDGSSCAITVVVATQVTCAALAAVTGGTGTANNDWNQGDAYKITNATLGNVIDLATATSVVQVTITPGTGTADLDSATVDAADFTVVGSTVSSATVDKAGTKILLSLAVALDTSGKPKLELPGTVKDLAGNTMAVLTSTSAITAVDGLAPVITGPDGAAAVTLTGTAASQTISNGDVVIAFGSGEAAATTPVVTGTYLGVVGANLGASAFVATPTVTSTGTNAWSATIKITTATSTSAAGLVNVRITLTDAAGNVATAGLADPDSTTALTSLVPTMSAGALVFEFDNRLNEGVSAATSVFTVSPDTAPTTNSFTTDTDSPFITIDFGNHTPTQNAAAANIATGGEDKEYSLPNGTVVGTAGTIETDTHGAVTLTSAVWGYPDGTTKDVLADVVAVDSNTSVFAPTGLVVGTHTLTIQGKDDAGNVSTSVGSTTATSFTLTMSVTARADYSVAIKPGSNLISIPAAASVTDINELIGASSPIDFVMTYDNPTGLWLVATRDTDADSDTFGELVGNLTSLDNTHAYWVNSDRFLSLKFPIPRSAAGTPSFPTIIPVFAGWNAVPIGDSAQTGVPTTGVAGAGYPDPDTYFAGVTWSAAYTFDTARNAFLKTTPVTTPLAACTPVLLGTVPAAGIQPCLQNGQGYFVYVVADGVIIP